MIHKYSLESPLDCKEIQPVHPKGNHPWIFIGRTDADAETPALWPPDAKSQPTGKTKKRMTEDEIVGWHRHLNEHEFEPTPRDEGQWSLVCCSPWGYKESDMTERLKTNFHGNNFLLIEWKINYNFVNIWENRWTAFRKKIYFLIHMKPSVNFAPIFNQIYMLFTMFAY